MSSSRMNAAPEARQASEEAVQAHQAEGRPEADKALSPRESAVREEVSQTLSAARRSPVPQEEQDYDLGARLAKTAQQAKSDSERFQAVQLSPRHERKGGHLEL